MKKILVLSLLAALAACQSVPDSIPPDLSAREFFQRAQEAVVERSDYRTALLYYQTFLERFPEDVQRGVEAEYEIAFIYYKLGEEQTAETLFRSLLSKYEREGAEILPQWPRILAEKILAQIEAGEDPATAVE